MRSRGGREGVGEEARAWEGQRGVMEMYSWTHREVEGAATKREACNPHSHPISSHTSKPVRPPSARQPPNTLGQPKEMRPRQCRSK